MLLQATKTVGKLLKPKDLVIFESTVFPGTTEDICIPILEKFSKDSLNCFRFSTRKLFKLPLEQYSSNNDT